MSRTADQKAQRIAHTIKVAKEKRVTLPTNYVIGKNVGWKDVRLVYALLKLQWSDVPEGYSRAEDAVPVTKEQRIAQLDKEILRLAEEYYSLIAPTDEENEEAQSLLWDDVRAEAECLIDSNSTLGKLYLADNARCLREYADEEKGEDDDTSSD